MAILIPAIDLRHGKCVRLIQGDPSQETIYNENPVEQAKQWADLGAEMLHIVDLDGAIEGEMTNFPIIEQITHAIDIPIELGGGIRDMGRLQQVIELGIDYSIIGTAAIKDPVFLKEATETYPGQIVIGVDIKNNRVAIKGWKEESEYTTEQFIKYLGKFDIKRIIYTDVHRDGMLEGPNITGLNKILEESDLEIIVSGGISSLNDLQLVAELNNPRIVGIISGKALYAGTIDFKEAIKKLQ